MYIRSRDLKILERRRDFLKRRVESREEVKDGDYDLAEYRALSRVINSYKEHQKEILWLKR